MKARDLPWWVKLPAAIVLLVVIISLFKACTAGNPEKELGLKVGNDLSAYIASKPSLKAKDVNLINVVVDGDDIFAEFSARKGSVFCRMAVDVPNKSVPRYHVIKWKPVKKDDAVTVASRLTEKDGRGLGCIKLLSMTGIGDDGQLSSS